MKRFRLKQNQPAFEVVDGLLAGRRFDHGKTYTEIPEAYRQRFEAVPEPKPAKAAEKSKE